MPRKILVLILFMSYLILPGRSQYHQIQYGVEDGLPSPETYFIHQDNDGYIWICTDRGLSRYNGYEFENFDLNDGLTSYSIFKVIEDDTHHLWFLCSDGSITIFDYQTKAFVPFWANSQIKSLLEPRSWFFSIGFKGDILTGYLNYDKYAVRNTTVIVNLSDSAVTKGNIDSTAYTEYDNQIICQQPWGLNSIHVTSYPKIKGAKTARGFGFKSDNALVNVYQNRIIYFKESTVYIVSDTDTTKINIDGMISSVMKDKEDNYWVSTTDNGIIKIPSTDFRWYPFDDLLESSDFLTAIGVYDGQVLVGTSVGYVLKFNSNLSAYAKVALNPFIRQHMIRYIKAYDKQLYTSGGRYQSLNSYQQELNTIDCSSGIIRLSSGQYVGYGIANELNYFEQFNINKVDRVFRFSSMIIALETDDYNGLYCSTFDSVYYINSNADLTNLTASWGLENTTVRNMISAGDSILIVGTSGRGINIIKAGKSELGIAQSDGLISNFINDIVLEKEGILWCATNRGISRIEYQDSSSDGLSLKKITNFSADNGLGVRYIRRLIIHNDSIYAISGKGLVVFKKDLVFNHTLTEVPRILEMKQNDALFNSGETLRFDENNITISYICVSTKKPVGQSFYRYRLQSDNWSQQWIETNNREAFFSQLPAGEYTFSLGVKTENGNWSENETVKFKIMPHWVKSWWAKSIGIVLLVFIGTFVYRRDQKKKQAKYHAQLIQVQRDNELKSAQLDVLKAQMNPHFVYNALQSAQRYLIEENSKSANRFISQLARLLRSGLEYSREKTIPLDDEVKYISGYLKMETSRFPHKFTYDIQVDNELELDLEIPPLIIQPLCENCIKHAYLDQPVHILVHFKWHSEYYMSVIVRDNGIGFDSDQQSKINKSLGLEILSERINLLKVSYPETKLIVSSQSIGTDTGTSVQLILPIQ